MINISKFFEDKYTIIFALLLVLLVSIWISRTYRNGGFGGWIAPAEGYGTGVIEGFTGSLMLPDASNERTYCNMVTGTIISEVGIPFSLTTAQAMPAAVAASAGPPPVSAIPAGEIYVNFPTGYFVPLLSTDSGTLSAKLFTNDGVRVDTGATGGTITFDPANAPTRLKYIVGGGAAVPAGTYVLKIYNLKLGAAVDAGTGQTGTITVTTSTTGSTTVLDILHPAIASSKKDPRFPESCRKMKVNPVVKVYVPPYEATLPKVSSPVYVKLVFTLTNTFANGDKFVVQIPELLQSSGGVNITTAKAETTPASTSFTSGTLQYSAANINAAASYYSKTNITFIPTLSSAIPAGTQITLEFGGLTTPANEKPQVNDSQIVAIQTINSADIMYERGIYSFPAITGGSAASPASSSTASGTASDGTTYVTAAASSVLISDVKRQSEWAINAQKAYETAWTKLRNASASEKTAAQDAYDVAVKIRNRLIASHPDSWFDGSAWRYGDDGYIKKCTEPSTLSSNEGNCQNIFHHLAF
jgi:hypothetical protein